MLSMEIKHGVLGAALALLGACGDDPDVYNDGPLLEIDQGSAAATSAGGNPASGGSAGQASAGGSAGQSGTGGESAGDGNAGGGGGGGPSNGASAGSGNGATGGSDGSNGGSANGITGEVPEPPAESVVAGSAIEAGCAGNSQPSGEQCGGYYCGTTLDAIAAETPAGSPCGGDLHAGLLCQGTISRVVSACARSSAFASDPVAATRTCGKNDAELAGINDQCLECFVQSAACAREHCLVTCLPGDSANCDQCRIDNGCTPNVFSCGNIPSPL